MEKRRKNKKNRRISLIVPVMLVFGVLGIVVFSVTGKILSQMSESAIVNLSENLDLFKGTIETIMEMEAEFQKLIAQEIALAEDPDQLIRSYNKNDTMIKLSLIKTGETEGLSNTGEVFSERELDFSAGNTAEGLLVSQSYLNSLGTWAYTMKCPVVKDDKEIGTLYIEYIYDSFDDALPDKFYNSRATFYIMDATSERLVLKPKGMGERSAGHLNLEDFYRANEILEPAVTEEVAESIKAGKDMMFYHNIQNKEALIYMWSVNDGFIYLIGYVPVEAIQREGEAVNQNIFIVIAVMLVAFLLCCILYFLNARQQNKDRMEREREREIHNQQMAEALQAAQAANHSKTTFLSNMSHDIRTPMNAILGCATLLTRDAENAGKVREYTKKIMATGQHLLGLINDVLDVSKIESGKVVLTIDEFTLNDMISSVDAIIRPAARDRGQSFEVSVTGVKHEYLLGDETRLNQILINLLSNAVKYTQEGGHIWLRIIGLKQRSKHYEHIRIEVEDDGYGMTPEYLKVLFDAFTRAENSTTNKVQGTGLGMAITKSIVELMGGTIEVCSEVDKGTIFNVELELRIPEEQKDMQFWKEHGISRILAVDTEEICRDIQTLMENSNVSVDIAQSGEEAVRMVQEHSYQVILLEWQLAGRDSLDTIRQLRAAITDYMPVLFLLVSDGEAMESEVGRAEVDGILVKPFFVSAFKEKLLEISLDKSEGLQGMEDIEDNCLEGRYFLVAEDIEINAEILLELLSIEGAGGEVAENGQLALERFRAAKSGEFDAVLMDVQMPVMNGYEATKAIRALEREDAKTIPIIAMTANAFAEDVRDAVNAGMNAHVSKPIDMMVLKKTLSGLL